MRVVFMGSPEFALPALRRLIDSEHEVVAVFTQPDRPSGRGRALQAPPVKVLALEHGLSVHQPPSISKRDVVDELRRLAPDVGVIAAYGQILRQSVLDVPPLGILNVHASLLPRWRGAAPIPAAILAGDAETGATIMVVVRELDAGPMLAPRAVPIGDDDTTATLTPRVAEAGADLLIDVLPRYASGDLQPVDQDEALMTYAPQLEKSDALIDWVHETAEQVSRKVRAYDPWPVAYTQLDGAPLRIFEARPIERADGVAPGTVVEHDVGFAVVCAEGALAVLTVQPPGRAQMPAAAFVHGQRGFVGKRLG